ncbi:hypothetical protein IC617_08780 [Neiella sp. HB171785]|uniref:Uncharacterized protein n=1 Tax=Neiella litorisoli TaxID=2771431 RepID=A0A8J6UG31_9GAMM|nr:hypothetical protein [Neiella litorisoli]MBD1389521.1 hypothetical protein [Neiella litorisoli]
MAEWQTIQTILAVNQSLDLRRKSDRKTMQDALCDALGVAKEPEYVVIARTHRRHGYNIQLHVDTVALVLSVMSDDRLYVEFRNGSTAFIRRSYTEPFKPYAPGSLSSINSQYKYGPEFLQKLGVADS